MSRGKVLRAEDNSRDRAKDCISPVVICPTFYRCLNDVQCKAYQLKKREPENCVLIQNICGNTEGQLFEKDDNNIIL